MYGQFVYMRRSSGLYNSTQFIVKALRPKGIDAHIVEVHDNNDIDREVTKFKPDIVVLEALWVVPEKFPILKRLHPKVKWFIHLHSDMPFLAIEGCAMDWIIKSAAQGIGIIANSLESFEALSPIVCPDVLKYLPNVYVGKMHKVKKYDWNKPTINAGCFGAVRPLKNHLLQALAALAFAREEGKFLRFHINSGRVETGGAPVLKNLRSLFCDIEGAELVEHHWFEPDDFVRHLHANLDIGMQVSLTETFNVVSADYVVAGLPIVVSKEVKWVSNWSHAIDNSLPDIVHKMRRALDCPLLTKLNQYYLKQHGHEAAELWYEWVRSLT